MPNWLEISEEIRATAEQFQAAGDAYDLVRRKYLQEFHVMTGRDVIVYHSGWLHHSTSPNVEIDDRDRTGFMTLVHRGTHKEGLDLILHTPGGIPSAAASIMDFLRGLYNKDIRAFIPQFALSAGTMMACGSNEIYMGTHSSLSPIDVQTEDGIPVWDIVEEFETIKKDSMDDPRKLDVWKPILSQLKPGMITSYKKLLEYPQDVVSEWLSEGMFSDLAEHAKNHKICKIIKGLADCKVTKTHERLIPIETCVEMELKIQPLAKEEHYDLKNALLAIHHACEHTVGAKPIGKLIENQNGKLVTFPA